MKRCLIRIPGTSTVYHVRKRCVGGQFLLNDVSKELFVRLLADVEAFSGVSVLNYCVLDNHYHLLVSVPAREGETVPTDAELLSRYGKLYGQRAGRGGYPSLASMRIIFSGQSEEKRMWCARLGARMEDLSAFMKTLNQRFSNAYNRRYNRFGTLWAEPFRADAVESCPSALAVVSAYIDLNPVRAGMVEDPGMYRWCGYGAAMGGAPATLQQLAQAMGVGSWEALRADYRVHLYGSSRKTKVGQGHVRQEKIAEVLRQGGKVPVAHLLRYRLCHLWAGAAIGSQLYLETLQEEFRLQLKRKRSRKKPRGLPAEGLDGVFGLV